MPAAPQLRIVIVAPEPLERDLADAHTESELERSRSLRIGLIESGYNIVAVLPADTFLTERLAQIAPDMVIVDAESQARDTLEHVVMATRDARRPIVLFTNDDDTSQVGAAIAAGVSADVEHRPDALRGEPGLCSTSRWRDSRTRKTFAANSPTPAPSSANERSSTRPPPR